ncbi:hypothetical protein DC522_14265 [Microvirga sp. KLBC 81]|uniref:hypothetical protein n=1 Tax=Microvirga sp. KLBC 81 TaxID=1862707 RepID=UPI000D50B31B|nr:hypothetical protein [Microvirga sp. KLBC 81]PVE23760.1 hypothetical protein DC522_14265 [Microvirga sp. KLBC 81]
MVGISAILTLTRFGDAFLVLRSQNVGLPLALVPTVMVVMNILYALAACPAGTLSGRLGHNGVLTVGAGFLIIADFIPALRPAIPLEMAVCTRCQLQTEE